MHDDVVVVEKKPIAYSYVRFSTVKQELGDSLRRQVEGAEDYCRENGLELHPVSYRDLGVSAFKGKNVEKGALAAFISAVKSGKIEKGSYLIIEQFDRLSRDDVDIALSLFTHLVRSGIIVVTLDDKKVWDIPAIKDLSSLLVAILLMSRANNESASKARRLSSVWTQKKTNAALPPDGKRRIVTSECPRWLSVNETKTGFIVLDDRVASIKKIFEMRIGGYGLCAITSKASLR